MGALNTCACCGQVKGEALVYLAPEQIVLSPDCGFAPTSTNPISLEEAYLKLRAMSEAARMLRPRYA